MMFTALHRALGRAPSPLTDELLQAAVNAGVEESDDLDWKSELPRAKGIGQGEFPKDIAAMANSGGGIIVYGVKESQKGATGRTDVGELKEPHERSLRSAAVTAITPPVFNLGVYKIGSDGGPWAVAVVVPASTDGPHLIYKGDYFAAPIRNDADTVWMKERQIESMYRARFDERRHSTEALDNLYNETAASRGSSKAAWFVAVAHPRTPRMHAQISEDTAKEILFSARYWENECAGHAGDDLLGAGLGTLRPGLRRWVAQCGSRWKRAWVSVHHDGSVTLAAEISKLRRDLNEDVVLDTGDVDSIDLEGAVAAFMGLLRATAKVTTTDGYEMRVGVAWPGEEPVRILTVDNFGRTFRDVSTPLYRFTPVETSINALEPDQDFFEHVADLARDCVNQGGISSLQLIKHPNARTK